MRGAVHAPGAVHFNCFAAHRRHRITCVFRWQSPAWQAHDEVTFWQSVQIVREWYERRIVCIGHHAAFAFVDAAPMAAPIHRGKGRDDRLHSGVSPGVDDARTNPSTPKRVAVRRRVYSKGVLEAIKLIGMLSAAVCMVWVVVANLTGKASSVPLTVRAVDLVATLGVLVYLVILVVGAGRLCP